MTSTNGDQKKWQAVFSEEESKVYRDKLAEIAELILKKTEEKDDEGISLMGGQAGVALFLFYYAQLVREEKYMDKGIDLLSQIFDTINDGFSYHTHAGGLAGVGWTVEHLVRHEFLEMDTNETLEELDPYLHKAMIYDIQNGNYDFLHGAVGNGTYFLYRDSNPKAVEYIEELVDELIKKAERDEDDGAAKWLATLDHEKGTQGYNLSLSHGIASIIAFLGKVVEKGICKEKASELLDAAVRYLLKHRLDFDQFNSHFPSWISPEHPSQGSRVAWCYGDLGIGVSLWHTARGVHNKEWEKIAMQAMLDTTKRDNAKAAGVMDVGLCHGSAGIAHIYTRAYNYTGREEFKKIARYWANQTLEMATFEDGFAGFKAWRTEKYGGWTPELGFLEGIAGIGLAFIGMISEYEPHWDRSLYIS